MIEYRQAFLNRLLIKVSGQEVAQMRTDEYIVEREYLCQISIEELVIHIVRSHLQPNTDMAEGYTQ